MPRCKNCGHDTSGTFCSHCGQKPVPPRISLSYVLHEVFHFFTHIRNGFPLTTFRMLMQPGITVVSFLEGKRKPYQSPVSYFLIWTTLFAFTTYLFDRFFGANQIIVYQNYFGEGATTTYVISHLSIMLTILIPFQSLYLYMLIMRPKFNYMESLVGGIYMAGTIIVLQFVFALIALGFALMWGRPLALLYSDIFKIGYFIWFTCSLLQALNIGRKWWRGFAFVIMAAMTFLFWRLFIIPRLAGWFIQNQ